MTFDKVTIAEVCVGLLASIGAVQLAIYAFDAPAQLPRAPAQISEKQAPIKPTPVASYTLVASLDPSSHSLTAKGTITFRNTSSKPLDTLFLHLYLNAFRSDKTAFMRRRGSGGRGHDRLTDTGSVELTSFQIREFDKIDLAANAKPSDSSPPDDLTDLQIPLPTPILPNTTIHIDLQWKTQLPNIIERSGYAGSFHMVGQWFPKLAKLNNDGTFAHFPYEHLAEFSADFGDYDVTIEVPSDYRLVATGQRVSDLVEAGKRRAQFKQSAIHDFAFSAYDRFVETERTIAGIKVSCFSDKNLVAACEEQLDALSFAIPYFANNYGPYPYPNLSVLIPPPGAWEAGGMEYPTFITTGGHWLASPAMGWSRALAVHEFGHQYFYGLLASNEAQWPFLDEGITSFAEMKALHEGWGNRSGFGLFGASLNVPAFSRAHALRSGNLLPIAQPASSFLTGTIYSSHVYSRTALVLDSFDRSYDGALNRSLQRYALKHTFAHPTPTDLLDAFRNETTEEAAKQLRIALFERGWTDNAVLDLSCASRCAALVARRGTLELPVDLEFWGIDGSRHRQVWNAHKELEWIEAPETMTVNRVLLDPDHKLGLDEDLANNAIGTSIPRANRILERGMYWSELFMGVGP